MVNDPEILKSVEYAINRDIIKDNKYKSYQMLRMIDVRQVLLHSMKMVLGK